MKICVTGGAGFIASNIVDKYIELGHDVVVIDNLSTGNRNNINPKAKFHELDVTSDRIEKIFEEEKFDILNHHAAQVDVRVSVNNPIFDAQTNIIGGVNLFNSAAKSGVKKIIFASSGGTVYGEQTIFPADESHPTEPVSPYGISKLANEKYIKYYNLNDGIDFVIFRYANIYGPRQNPFGEAGVVAIFANKMLKGEQAFINGDGENTRDYVYVDDVVNANVIALQANLNGIYNIGTATENDVNYIFNSLKKIIGAECDEIHNPAKPGEQRRSVISYQKFNEVCGWTPQTNLFDGLIKTVDFFKKSK